MSEAVIVGAGPNGLACAATLATRGVGVTVIEAAEKIGGGARTSELTLPGLLHDDCSAVHALAVGSAALAPLRLDRHGLEWAWPEVDLSHPFDGGSAATMLRSIDETAAGLGGGAGLEAALRRLLGVLRPPHRGHPAADHQPRPATPAAARPLRPAGGGAGVGAGPRAAHARGPGALRRQRGARLPAALCALQRLGRDGADLRLPPQRLAGRPRRLRRDRRRSGVGDPRAERQDRDRQAGALPRRAARRRRGRPRPGARRGGGDRRRAAAATGRPRLPALQARPGRLQGRPGGRGRRALGRPASGRAGTVHAIGSFEEVVLAEREVSRGRMPERPFVLVCQQYLADPARSRGDVHPVWAYAHVPAGYPGRRQRGDPRPGRTLRPGPARSASSPRRRARPSSSAPTTPTTSAATS